jgi:hypothetical protein
MSRSVMKPMPGKRPSRPSFEHSIFTASPSRSGVTFARLTTMAVIHSSKKRTRDWHGLRRFANATFVSRYRRRAMHTDVADLQEVDPRQVCERLLPMESLREVPRASGECGDRYEKDRRPAASVSRAPAMRMSKRLIRPSSRYDS